MKKASAFVRDYGLQSAANLGAGLTLVLNWDSVWPYLQDPTQRGAIVKIGAVFALATIAAFLGHRRKLRERDGRIAELEHQLQNTKGSPEDIARKRHMLAKLRELQDGMPGFLQYVGDYRDRDKQETLKKPIRLFDPIPEPLTVPSFEWVRLQQLLGEGGGFLDSMTPPDLRDLEGAHATMVQITEGMESTRDTQEAKEIAERIGNECARLYAALGLAEVDTKPDPETLRRAKLARVLTLVQVRASDVVEYVWMNEGNETVRTGTPQPEVPNLEAELARPAGMFVKLNDAIDAMNVIAETASLAPPTPFFRLPDDPPPEAFQNLKPESKRLYEVICAECDRIYDKLQLEEYDPGEGNPRDEGR